MFRTFLLMSGLILLFMFVGSIVAGAEGMKSAFLIACGINLFSYFFSDKLVLKHYNAKEVRQNDHPELYQIVARLANNAHLPMPKVYIVSENVPNAFATGRNPQNAAVAVTTGLLQSLTPQELEGVLAHEMTHVRNYDILTSTIAAVFAGAITMLARGGGYSSRSNTNRNGGALLGVLLMPLAATVIQLAISRSREYKADEGSAKLTMHPEWLISALQKLENYSQSFRLKNANSQTAHMFIISPFGSLKQGMQSLFSTHPSTADRIQRLRALANKMY